MDETEFEIDPELLAGFVDEAEEGLAEMDNLFVRLEESPGDLEIINGIFRPIHTIKGNSAFFGLMKLKKLAHEMETLLSLAKESKLQAGHEVISVLLEGVDELKAMLCRARDGGAEVTDEAGFERLVAKVVAARQLGGAEELWGQFLEKLGQIESCAEGGEGSIGKLISELKEILGQIRGGCEKKEAAESKAEGKDKKDIEDMQAWKRVVSFLEMPEKEAVEEIEQMQESLRQLQKYTRRDTDCDRQAGRVIESALGCLEGGDVEGLRGKLEKLVALEQWYKMRGVDGGQGGKSADKGEGRKTMRVTEESIDNFLNYVGELIVLGEMYGHLEKYANDRDSELTNSLKQVNQTFDNLSDNLRKSIMEIRKVKINTVLQKVPRLVRDLCQQCGKEVQVEINGEDTDVDKRLIETLDGPLTHMVRNAVDHGIEKPDERVKAGKERKGCIRIQVSENDDMVVMSIADDGKGLNKRAIRAKAVAAGLISGEQELMNEQMVDMIFASGISTAEKVTDVSGRGVGMDVVQKSIMSANGKISVRTEEGKGTEFVIELPKSVSTQIIDGFMVEVRGKRYVLPMEQVNEVFRPGAEDVSSVQGRGECVLRHGQLLGVTELAELFGESDTDGQNQGKGIMVLVTANHRRMALLVDGVLGVGKVVLKEVEGMELNNDLYSAAAVMGDGTVSMVLDLDCIGRAAVCA